MFSHVTPQCGTMDVGRSNVSLKLRLNFKRALLWNKLKRLQSSSLSLRL